MKGDFIMKNSEKLALQAEYHEVIAGYARKGSTATVHFEVDGWVRDYLTKKGITRADDIGCRRQEQDDFAIRVNGKLNHGETKIGEGAVCYAPRQENLSITEDMVLSGKDLIAYATCADGITKDTFMKLMYMFTREQFIACLSACGKNGLNSTLRIKQAKRGQWQLEIQHWNPRPEERFFDWIEKNNIPTLEEFKKALRG